MSLEFTKSDIEQLEKTAAQLRFDMVRYSHQTRTPHLGSCLSCTDILTALYFKVMNFSKQNHQDPLRDRFILSKGHAAPALFQVLNSLDIISDADLWEAHPEKFGEHPPTPEHVPGIEAATGALGHGLPIGVGISLSAKLQNQDFGVYALLGDGECNEGSVWEAALLAASQQLDNVMVFIDFNKWQATGRSCEVMSLSPLTDKWKAFGWHVEEVDGHDMGDILSKIKRASAVEGKPKAIVAHTVKGKGVSFMEDDNNWHYRTPNAEEVEQAGKELGCLT